MVTHFLWWRAPIPLARDLLVESVEWLLSLW